MSLGEALDALEKDETVKSAMPDEMYRVFMHYKRDEWEKLHVHRHRLGSASSTGTICRKSGATAKGDTPCAELQD